MTTSYARDSQLKPSYGPWALRLFLFLPFWFFFWLSKKCLKNFCSTKNWMMKGIVNKKVFKIMNCPIIVYLFAGLKTIILCSVHPKLFVKYVFLTKYWFVKTSTRIVKYESQVVKLNPISGLRPFVCNQLNGAKSNT